MKHDSSVTLLGAHFFFMLRFDKLIPHRGVPKEINVKESSARLRDIFSQSSDGTAWREHRQLREKD